jgi:tRNA(fMet)-specific endonuclease VapC
LVAVDADTAGQYADIREELRTAATPIPENDIWIAALCRQHQLPLASRDGHFDKVRGLKRVGW